MTYSLDSAAFGFYDPSGDLTYMSALGYAGYNQGVILSFNYQGLGLPPYMWN